MVSIIDKELRKLSDKERVGIKRILRKIVTGDTSSMDIKKLKGREDIFRIRKGNIRIIYRRVGDEMYLLTIERRDAGMYRKY